MTFNCIDVFDQKASNSISVMMVFNCSDHNIRFLLMQSSTTTSLADFQLLTKIGDGSFAEVFKVKRKEDGQIYALKKIRMAGIKDKDRQNALNQIRLLASQQGDHIIGFKEAFYDHNAAVLYIIMEFAEQGDLLHLVQSHAKKNTKLAETQIWKALVHIVRGLNTLHEKKILHRDLKGANVFITKQGVYKLGDLNVSKVIKNDMAKTQTGTPYYASPQVWKDLPYGTKSDMWSLGCVIYEMAAQRPPFTGTDIQVLYKRVMNGYYPRIPSVYSNELADIISSLLRLNPADRPTASQLLSNSAIKRHIEEDVPESFNWDNDELLSTIKLPNRNFKMINDILPKAQYNKKNKENDSKEETIVGDFFKQSDSKPKVCEQKGRLSSSKFRVRSMYTKEDQTKRESVLPKRQRIVSNYSQINQTGQSSINDIPIFKEITDVSRMPKKTYQLSKILKSPPLSKVLSKDVDVPSSSKPNFISRKKVESVIDKILSAQSTRGRNKQNFRRVGQNVVGAGSRRSVRQYK